MALCEFSGAAFELSYAVFFFFLIYTTEAVNCWAMHLFLALAAILLNTPVAERHPGNLCSP